MGEIFYLICELLKSSINITNELSDGNNFYDISKRRMKLLKFMLLHFIQVQLRHIFFFIVAFACNFHGLSDHHMRSAYNLTTRN